MTFPTNWDSTTGARTSNTTSHPVTLPAVVSGQLLYVAMSFDGNPTVTWDNSTAGTWTSYVDTPVGTATKLVVRAKVADGTEGGKILNITTSANEQSVYRAVSVQNWEGTLAGGFNCPAAATGVTSTPNPPAATDSWGSVDRKTVAVFGCDNGNRTVSAYPSGYTLNQFSDTSAGPAGVVLGAAGRNATEGSQDPGTYTISASDDWVAATISIKGGTAGAGPTGWTVLDSGGSVGTFTTLVSASISPDANALVLCLVNGMGVNTTDRVVPSSVASGGSSFTLIDSEIIGPYSIGSVWRYLNATPFSGAVTITFSNSQDTGSYVIIQRTGVDTTGTNGSGAVGTVAKSSGTSTSPSPGTISFPGSGDETFVGNFWGNPASATARNHVQDADFIELGERVDIDSGWYTAVSPTIATTQQTTHTSTLAASETWVSIGFAVKLAAAGVSVALTGSSSTASAGTLGVTRDKALSGSAATASAGTATPGTSKALTGEQAASSAGTVSPATIKTLAGEQAASSVGALVPGTSKALTGSEATVSAGTVTPLIEYTAALTGSEATASAGTVSPATSKALTGEQAASAAGTAAPSISIALTGSQAATSAGTLTPVVGSSDVEVALTGSQATTSAGTIGPETSKALAGEQAASAAGTLSPAASIALSGAQVASSAGQVSPGTDKALTGESATAAAGTLTPVAAYEVALTGSQATVTAGALVPGLSKALTGEEAATSAGSLGVQIGNDVIVALTGSVVTASAGTLTPVVSDEQPQTQTTGAPGGSRRPYVAFVNGKRVYGSYEELIELIESLAERDAQQQAAGEKPKKRRIVIEPGKSVAGKPETRQKTATKPAEMAVVQEQVRDIYRAAYNLALQRLSDELDDEESILLLM